jgi:dTDP-4-amino-4,6-dideoxy-D-glucose acyltransferase
MAFLSEDAVAALGFARVGRDVKISEKASIYRPERISIADHARIDDFCILSAGDGGIDIGNYVHIACYASLIGREQIVLRDFASLSGRVSVYSSSEDHSGASLTNPTVPEVYRGMEHGRVLLERHVIVGAGSVILPGVTLGLAASVGAITLVATDLEAFGMYMGVPARKIGTRKQDLLELEKRLGGSF